jgi:ribosomal protein S18 acetylase RimI-like enzyme
LFGTARAMPPDGSSFGIKIMHEIKYRQAIEKDIPRVVELWEEFIDFHKDRDSFFSRAKEGPENFGKFVGQNLRKQDAIVYVAEKDGVVIGHILATIQNYPPVFEIERYGLINDLAVSSAYRRNGIGRHLFVLAKKWLVKKGINRIEIEVAIANEVSTSFWKKMSFKPYKRKCYLEL